MTVAKVVLLIVGLGLLTSGLLVAGTSLSPAFLDFANGVAEVDETPASILRRSIFAAAFGGVVAVLGAVSLWRALAQPSVQKRVGVSK